MGVAGGSTGVKLAQGGHTSQTGRPYNSLTTHKTHLKAGGGVAGAEVRLPVVEAEVGVSRHQPPRPVKVGLYVWVRLEAVRKVYIATDLCGKNGSSSSSLGERMTTSAAHNRRLL